VSSPKLGRKSIRLKLKAQRLSDCSSVCSSLARQQNQTGLSLETQFGSTDQVLLDPTASSRKRSQADRMPTRADEQERPSWDSSQFGIHSWLVALESWLATKNADFVSLWTSGSTMSRYSATPRPSVRGRSEPLASVFTSVYTFANRASVRGQTDPRTEVKPTLGLNFFKSANRGSDRPSDRGQTDPRSDPGLHFCQEVKPRSNRGQTDPRTEVKPTLGPTPVCTSAKSSNRGQTDPRSKPRFVKSANCYDYGRFQM